MCVGNGQRVYVCTHWVRRDLQEGTGLASDWQWHHARHAVDEKSARWRSYVHQLCAYVLCAYLCLFLFAVVFAGELEMFQSHHLVIICASGIYSECIVRAS